MLNYVAYVNFKRICVQHILCRRFIVKPNVRIILILDAEDVIRSRNKIFIFL